MGAMRVDSSYLKDLQKTLPMLRDLMKDKGILAKCVRLSIHDAFAYDAKKRVYGANASIRTQKELAHKGNEGLAELVSKLGEIKTAAPSVSFADLYQLASCVAIRTAGGPPMMYTPGRKDGWSFPPQSAYLKIEPGDKALGQFNNWISRTGLTKQQATALLGAKSLTRWWLDAQDSVDEPLTNSTFDNSYFSRLIANDEPEDAWLLSDPEIKKYVELYASDKDAFFKDYAEAHGALSLLGTGLTPSPVHLSSPTPYYMNASGGGSPEYAITMKEYAVYAGTAIAATGAIAYGAWKIRQRYLRTGKLFTL